MTIKKTKKVVSKRKETKKVSDIADKLQSKVKSDFGDISLNGIFGELEKIVKKTSEELGIHTKENHDYYITYAYMQNGQLKIGGSAFGTNLNPFSKMGLGLRLIKEQLKISQHIEGDFTILNVMRLED